MKSLSVFLIPAFLIFTEISYAQTSTPAVDPTQQQEGTDTDEKADFASPQAPARLPNSPSEDTLIKATRSGALIRDTLVPSVGRKSDNDNDKVKRRGTKKGDNQIDTASIKSGRQPVPR